MSLSKEDLLALSREQLLELAVTRKMQEAVRERMALRLFIANPGAQQKFQKSQKRLRFLFGGNRTGKSEIGGVEALRFALGKHPFRPYLSPQSGWIVSPSFEVQRESAQQKILKYLPTSDGIVPRIIYRDRGRDYIDRIELTVAIPGGGKKIVIITFKSAEQGRTSFQGASVPWVWIDEELPIDIYQEIVMRTIDTQGNIWGTMTPLIGELYDMVTEDEKFQSDPELEYWHMSWADNPYLSKEELARLRSLFSEEELSMREHGMFAPREGRVYREFLESVHVIDEDEFEFKEQHSRYMRTGVDYGVRAPVCMLGMTINEQGQVIVFDEYYQAEKVIAEHAAGMKLVMERPLEGSKVYVCRRNLADPALWNRERDLESVAGDFRKHGVVLAPAPKGQGLWEARTDRLKGLLKYEREGGEWVQRPGIYITKRCRNLIRELRKYVWKPSRVNNMSDATKGADHAIDALNYGIEDLAPYLGKAAGGKIVRQKPKSGPGVKPPNRYTGR